MGGAFPTFFRILEMITFNSLLFKSSRDCKLILKLRSSCFDMMYRGGAGRVS